MGNLTETEVKLHVPDLVAMTARLEEAGAVLEAGRVYERNVRYENPVAPFSARGIVLRLREDTRVRLTYKESPRTENGLLTRFEAEVTVEDFETMDVILKRLGFRPFVLYEKYRTTYVLGEAEIVLDEMPYGNFVEIEGTAPVIESTLVRLGLADTPRIPTSYLSLFFHVRKTLGLAAHDLTFANFEGVTVPPDVFLNLG